MGDIEIARSVKLKPINDIATSLNIDEEYIENTKQKFLIVYLKK